MISNVAPPLFLCMSDDGIKAENRILVFSAVGYTIGALLMARYRFKSSGIGISPPTLCYSFQMQLSILHLPMD
jgi:hypothetical protein